ncbi:hypothetical protein JW921_04400 [Candidatus Fermentibacterales bacterium]|nr:hypothetical protein [Candidatus Fermentibacterales bacterium]
MLLHQIAEHDGHHVPVGFEEVAVGQEDMLAFESPEEDIGIGHVYRCAIIEAEE